MATPASPSYRAFFHEEPMDIPEDSAILRTLCCIPCFGSLASTFVEASLNQKWGLTKNEPRLIELLHIKNQYKVANLIRNVLTVALFVAAIAYKVIALTPFHVVCGTTLFLSSSALHMLRRSDNIELIEEIKTTGYKTHMQME